MQFYHCLRTAKCKIGAVYKTRLILFKAAYCLSIIWWYFAGGQSEKLLGKKIVALCPNFSWFWLCHSLVTLLPTFVRPNPGEELIIMSSGSKMLLDMRAESIGSILDLKSLLYKTLFVECRPAPRIQIFGSRNVRWFDEWGNWQGEVFWSLSQASNLPSQISANIQDRISKSYTFFGTV